MKKLGKQKAWDAEAGRSSAVYMPHPIPLRGKPHIRDRNQ